MSRELHKPSAIALGTSAVPSMTSPGNVGKKNWGGRGGGAALHTLIVLA